MVILEGKSACSGIAFGKLLFFKQEHPDVQENRVNNIDGEIERYRQASRKAASQLEELYKKAMKEAGEADAQIFQIHQMMLEDDDYRDSVESTIRTQQVNAEYAVNLTGNRFSKMFADMDDAYMKGRAADVEDISGKLIMVLSGNRKLSVTSDSPVILAADDLTPSETVQLDKSIITAFATIGGSVNSHTAILARAMNIPAVIGVDGLTLEYDGREAAIDGDTGKIYIEPDADTALELRRRFDEEAENRKRSEQLKGKDNVTIDGHRIDLSANIGSPEDVETALSRLLPFDWRGFFTTRIYELQPRLSLEGFTKAGWKVVYDARRNGFEKAWAATIKQEDHTASIGAVLGAGGEVRDVVVGSPAWRGGFAQGMKIVTVNDKKFSPQVLEEALAAASSQSVALTSTRGASGPLEFALEQAGETIRVMLDYTGGSQHAYLMREPSRPDVLSAILAPRGSP
jgi:phosphohistidine swiveling domain-containing protein